MLWLGPLSGMMVRVELGPHIHHCVKVLTVLRLGILYVVMVRVGSGLHIHHRDKV